MGYRALIDCETTLPLNIEKYAPLYYRFNGVVVGGNVVKGMKQFY